MTGQPFVSIVTGAAGFLGSHVVDLLLKNEHYVIAIDNISNGTWSNLSYWKDHPHLKVVTQDIGDIRADSPLFRNVDYIFHLAGKECDLTSLIAPEEFFKTNVDGTLKVLQASLQSNIKSFVYASSSAIYGKPNTPTLEKDKATPLTPSALSKHLAEQSVFLWGKLHNFSSISLRIFNAYGPRSINKVLPGSEFSQLMSQKFHNKKGIILGHEDQERDFIFCTDVANAFLTAAEEGKAQSIYNIGSGQSRTIESLCSFLKMRREIVPINIPWPNKTWADISKFQFDCNWQPRIPFETGMKFSMEVLSSWKDSHAWELNDYEKLIHPLRKK